jgi:hypothetical protein
MTGRRLWAAAIIGASIWIGALALGAAPALASTEQLSIIQDPDGFMSDPAGTLSTIRALGTAMIRVVVVWAQVAPDPTAATPPPGFDAADPADYPAAGWAPYDRIVQLATSDGIGVDLTVSGGAPLWAEGPGVPAAALANPYWAWRPSAQAFGQFVQAIGERYSGAYVPHGANSPLPRVSFWAIWNEPNFGEDLGPQATDGSTVSVGAEMYRDLADEAWSALQATGHTTATDTIVFGEVAPRGASGPTTRAHPQGLPGDFGMTRPLAFTRTLYCVNSSYRELRGAAAKAVGCPATAAASRSFRHQNPVLFDATGFADHPYPQNKPPTVERSSSHDITPFPRLADLERELDRLQRLYGSGRQLPVYNTEYGYITNPPNPGNFVSPATAAYYLNWTEYLSWKRQRIASTMQYPLYDPVLDTPDPGGDGGFSSGLLYSNGQPKPGFAAYRLPLYLPVTSTRPGRQLEVWGCVRPARYTIPDTGQVQTAQIQFAPAHSDVYTALRTVSISDPADCYFDLRMGFPGSGTVRLAYTYPPGPSAVDATTVYSRSVAVSLR